MAEVRVSPNLVAERRQLRADLVVQPFDDVIEGCPTLFRLIDLFFDGSARTNLPAPLVEVLLPHGRVGGGIGQALACLRQLRLIGCHHLIKVLLGLLLRALSALERLLRELGAPR